MHPDKKLLTILIIMTCIAGHYSQKCEITQSPDTSAKWVIKTKVNPSIAQNISLYTMGETDTVAVKQTWTPWTSSSAIECPASTFWRPLTLFTHAGLFGISIIHGTLDMDCRIFNVCMWKLWPFHRGPWFIMSSKGLVWSPCRNRLWRNPGAGNNLHPLIPGWCRQLIQHSCLAWLSREESSRSAPPSLINATNTLCSVVAKAGAPSNNETESPWNFTLVFPSQSWAGGRRKEGGQGRGIQRLVFTSFISFMDSCNVIVTSPAVSEQWADDRAKGPELETG